MSYGLQLYSIRDIYEQGIDNALKNVSELGYTSVEFAGFYDCTAKQVREALDKYNLKIEGSHSPLAPLLDDYDNTVAFHKEIGNPRYIIPAHSLGNQAALDKFVDQVNVLSKKLAAEGITLGFHNHSGEFLPQGDGSVIMEQLIYRTDLKLEIDTFWAFVGMKNPVALLNRLGDRVNIVHIKDGNEEHRGMPLGKGVAPVKDVVAKVKEMGIPMIVESETLTPDGLTEAKIWIDYLRSLEA